MTCRIALATTTPSALKRHAPAEFDEVDSENIDPLIFSSTSKKGRAFDFNLTKSNVTPLFALPPPKPAQYIERAQAAGQKRKADDTMTPTAGMKRRVEPSSAPAPAGRSPKHKRIGILSRRRMTTNSFTRVNPPSSSTGESRNGLPFSIDAALAGTIPQHKSKSTQGKGWHFEIHEDTREDEMSNLMQHSTCTLDISDDESSSLKGDKDNKENIPPIDGPAAVTSATQHSATRRDMMTDDIREPLGDLDAKDFYAEGCDESSCIAVAAEDSSEQIMDKLSNTINTREPSSLPRPHATAVNEAQAGWEDVIARFAIKSTSVADVDLGIERGSPKEAAEIQIWESESAKGDDDADAPGVEIDNVSPQSSLT